MRLPAVSVSAHQRLRRQWLSKSASDATACNFGLESAFAQRARPSAVFNVVCGATAGRSRLAASRNIAPSPRLFSLKRSIVVLPLGSVASQSKSAVRTLVSRLFSVSASKSEAEPDDVHSTNQGSPERKTRFRLSPSVADMRRALGAK
eukprot:5740063-Pleurochrysis_carterae.AAC.2